ncbi:MULTISPECIES: LacI family DNA-binding transcriptional regulator [unclassified Micromonospora]|uniref:LacI family DNA-binding transcriptional regulator n=1 Tax=unclassified Micromonospora TaxID=2617518 RepID=UPI001C24576F|nr:MULTISPECIES: LacI family DNA-binding transcriptional regulator [unclassified Micromonospora]MBU8860867.1 LacI family transcriptional regulator [Micromonospora sp. WMMB482]MDM4780409.1 LacI family DNA-binding transcriptional regulator [Micromonospora sp. b486]
MPITIADVATRAGVSKTTVSRVLNGKGEVHVRTADRVRAVISDLGYVPSARAVGLARGRTRVVGMLVPALTWPWMGEVLQGAADVVEAAGYGMLLFTCTHGDESMRRFASQVSAKSFDGLLVVEPEGTLDYITELHRRGLPVILIDDRGHQPGFPSVRTTNEAGARAAAAHLLALGRRRPLVITGLRRFGCTRERLAGFAGAYAGAGVPVEPDRVVEGDFTFECGRAAVRRLLADGVPFDAVFAHNDLSAAGALQALRDAGRRVPQDVAVVGFDDLPLAGHTHPPLSSVRQPLREMGTAAASLLIGHLTGTPLPDTPTVIPTGFTARDSTGAGENTNDPAEHAREPTGARAT